MHQNKIIQIRFYFCLFVARIRVARFYNHKSLYRMQFHMYNHRIRKGHPEEGLDPVKLIMACESIQKSGRPSGKRLSFTFYIYQKRFISFFCARRATSIPRKGKRIRQCKVLDKFIELPRLRYRDGVSVQNARARNQSLWSGEGHSFSFVMYRPERQVPCKGDFIL